MTNKTKRRIGLMIYDSFFIVFSWWLSGLLFTTFYRHSYERFQETYILQFPKLIPFMILWTLVVFALTGVYRNLWQYFRIGDLIRITIASILANFLIFISFKIFAEGFPPAAIGIMTFYLVLTFSGGIRAYKRILSYVDLYLNRKLREALLPRTLVVGGGRVSVLDKGAAYHIVAYVDDRKEKQFRKVAGTEVAGSTADIELLVDKLDVDDIIIDLQGATRKEIRRVLELCPLNRCRLHIVDADCGLRLINISDIMGREINVMSQAPIERLIKGKTVLVTGGGGSIGSELCRQIIKFEPKKLVVYDMYENNAYDLYKQLGSPVMEIRIGSVQSEARLGEIFSEFLPEIVFHAAAYKHVPLMEQSPEMAIENNVFGTYKTAHCSYRHNVKKFIMISTDKAVNPTNIMGASKRIAELVVQSFNSLGGTEFSCVRFGNVLGSNGSVLPIFQRQIEAGGPVTVTHPEITRFFMTIPEAARLVLQTAALTGGGEIYILDMGEPVKIADLATTMIQMAGLRPGKDREIVYTGLRPGEKLYEELLLSGEGYIKTESDDIYIVKHAKVDFAYADKILNRLRAGLEKHEDIKRVAAEVLPEYRRKD